MSSRYAATSPEIEQKGWNGVYLTDPVRHVLDFKSKHVEHAYVESNFTDCRANLATKVRRPVIRN